MSLFNQTVTIENRTVAGDPDEYGNDVFTTTTSTSAAWFEIGGTSEIVDGRNQVEDRPVVWLPLTASVSATSVIVHDGVRYEVDGKPGRQPGGDVVEGYIRVPLSEVAG